MTGVPPSLEIRRRRRRNESGSLWPILGLALCVGLVLAAGAVVLAAGRLVFAEASDLPDVSAAETLFGPSSGERFRPTQLFDRSGTVLLAEVGHPLAGARTWQSLDGLPASVAQATVAALDPDFWNRPQATAESALAAIARSLIGQDTASAHTIPERLATQMIPADTISPVGMSILGAELDAAYPRSRILEWFLNSAGYGNLAFGIDAASLVYFGKHADSLSLSEAALLAGLPGHPEIDPFADPQAAQRLKAEVLDAMVRQGTLSAADAQAAGREPVGLQAEEAKAALSGLGFVESAWEELTSRVGQGIATQGGARVVTTLDLDLQLQADCVTRSQLLRMGGGAPTDVLPAVDGSPCVAASLLPPMRPGDVGVDHGMGPMALMVVDAKSGEILAQIGSSEAYVRSGGVLTPLVYLSALAHGFTPATMLVDDSSASSSGSPDQGLMRLRTALATARSGATRRLIAILGESAVARTIEQMGIAIPEGETTESSLALGDVRIRMIDLAGALTTLANGGIQVGYAVGEGGPALEPSLLRSVQTSDGETLYEARAARKAVLSEGLSYLMNQMLSDETARWPLLGQGNLLEIGRPAAALIGDTAPASDNWAVGYTPSRVVTVWVGARKGASLAGVRGLNGAAPIWETVMRYATRDLPAEDWPRPADITEADVCDPSGYLATPYCPNVVREIFLAGTEPTHSDTFYRPFRVNRETGRLATFFTPLDQIDERVYFVPPPEAAAAGITAQDAPPTEYDRIDRGPANPEVRIATPSLFDMVSGRIEVTGSADGEDFASYRLDRGEGLDPQAWVQIGDDSTSAVSGGALGDWDTSGLAGIYILRLTVVRGDGSLDVDAVPVTVDNDPPQVNIVLPSDQATVRLSDGKDLAVQAEAHDDTALSKVVLYVDGRATATRTDPPWSFRWPLGAAGEHVLRARAYDTVGNFADSGEVTIVVER